MLKIEHFSLSYEGESLSLKDISLSVEPGECLILSGESGSGKSSLIHAINGLAYHYDHAQCQGSIEFCGKNLQELPLYQVALQIASVFQNPKTHFFNVNTTLELLFGMENMGLDRREMDERMTDLLSIFPIEHLLGRNIFALSGGEKQILSVASAYLSGCKLIVLDEPSSNLDEKSIAVLQKMLLLLKERGISLLIAEHRLYYLMDLMDRLLFLEKGRIVKAFSKEEFLMLKNEEVEAMGLRSREKLSLSLPKWKNEGDFTIEYPSGATIRTASFSFGKIYGIIGENGCGKSTFLRAISGLSEKRKVKVSLFGKVLSKRKRISLSSLVMQDVNSQLFSDSVEEELMLSCKGQKWTEEMDSLLSSLDLVDLKKRHPMSLSGGQKQRLAIAASLLQDAKFLYFDEPTSGMDERNMLRIAKLLKSQVRDDRILFVVSHDTAFLQEVATEIVDLTEFRE